MEVIGFNLDKILVERRPAFKQMSNVSTNVEFTSVDKEKIDMFKEKEVFKIKFKFMVLYVPVKEDNDKKKVESKDADGEVLFEGYILLAAEKEEGKEIFKAWKKKELPIYIKVPLFNLILKRCTTKALQLEEDVNLPIHVPLPQLQPAPKTEENKN